MRICDYCPLFALSYKYQKNEIIRNLCDNYILIMLFSMHVNPQKLEIHPEMLQEKQISLSHYPVYFHQTLL